MHLFKDIRCSNIKNIIVVSEWGVTPRNSDSHLINPTSSDGTFHSYFSSKSYSESGAKIADIDLDDTSSYGPETTIYNPIEGEYVFSVPLTGNGRYWSVFIYDSKTRRVKPINIVANSVQTY